MVFTTPLTKRHDFAFFTIVFSRVFRDKKKEKLLLFFLLKNSFYHSTNKEHPFH